VISGVVGIRKFAYDIWRVREFRLTHGIQRLTRSCEPSATTFSKVKDFFECEPRGKVATKEGREFEMYFAVGPVPSLNTPEAFSARYEKYFQKKTVRCP